MVAGIEFLLVGSSRGHHRNAFFLLFISRRHGCLVRFPEWSYAQQPCHPGIAIGLMALVRSVALRTRLSIGLAFSVIRLPFAILMPESETIVTLRAENWINQLINNLE